LFMLTRIYLLLVKIELLVKILCIFLVYCFFLYYVCFYLRVNNDEYIGRSGCRCPRPCDASPYRRGNSIMCVSQLHPYTPFSAAVKVTNTW